MKRILVVEDNADIAEAMCQALELGGHVPETAHDGAEALKRLEADPLPDLILLDITMPVMDGAEFLTRRKGNSRAASIPVILMSAAHDRARKGVLLEVSAHLRKPVSLDQLLDAVENKSH